jgi:hypothetical protein
MLNISESGMLLESSAKPMAGLPAQAFAISLSASVIDDMIACVQNGGDIQLALGSSPVSVGALAFWIVSYCCYSVRAHNTEPTQQPHNSTANRHASGTQAYKKQHGVAPCTPNPLLGIIF